MSTNKVKRLSKTITKEEIIIENIEEKKAGETFKIEQRNKSPDNSKCCGLFSCCSVHNNIQGNNNNVNTDKTIDNKADVNVGLNNKKE